MDIIFCLLLWLATLLLPTTIHAIEPFQSELPNSWTYHKIFGPSDLPLPDSAKNYGAYIKATYSPSVTKFQNQLIMLFGISIYCQSGTVARDTIALAKSSDDGNNWRFDRYLIEPSAETCQKPLSQWGKITFQVNDPKAFIPPNNSDQLMVFYTTVTWPDDNYGHIGIAHLDKNLNITYRNDKYLQGSNILGGMGFSRPDIQWLSDTDLRLWVDSGGNLGSIPLSNYTSLDQSKIRNEKLVGIDINFPKLSYSNQLILVNGSVIQAMSKNSASSTWGPRWNLTTQSGQTWDTWYQGSPELYLDPITCKLKLYFAGAVNAGSNIYESISIGVAVPPNNRIFSFPLCNQSLTLPGDFDKSGKVDLLDYNLLASNFGNPYSLLDYNLIATNFGK